MKVEMFCVTTVGAGLACEMTDRARWAGGKREGGKGRTHCNGDEDDEGDGRCGR